MNQNQPSVSTSWPVCPLCALWFTTCDICGVAFALTCSALIEMSDCALKAVRRSAVYCRLLKPEQTLCKWPYLHNNKRYIRNKDAWEYLSAYILCDRLDAITNIDFSPVWGCGCLPVCLGGSWRRPEGGRRVCSARSGSRSPSRDKTSAR